jgi:peptidoglycan/LPS O-acetylase OafA/YrhL
VSLTPTAPAPRRTYLRQIDLVRILPMVGVVTVHTITSTQPGDSIPANALLMVLHVNREMFFLLTAFVLAYSARPSPASLPAAGFWRRRYPLVLAPYLAWTLIYWILLSGPLLPLGPALARLVQFLLTGYWQLYFLLVTMQIYAVFPLLLWAARRTRPWHRQILVGSLVLQVLYTLWLRYPVGGVPPHLQTWYDHTQMELPSYQFYVVAGILAAEHFEEIRAWLRGRGPLVLLATLLAASGAELLFVVDVSRGLAPSLASNVFQPMMPLLAVATLAGLYLLGDRLLQTQAVDGGFWRAVSWAARASFGVYLAHALALTVVLETPLLPALGLAAPTAARTLVTLGLTLASTALMVELLGRTRFSLLLTGRPPLRRAPRPRDLELAVS